MTHQKFAKIAALVSIFAISCYTSYKLGDRTKPYEREYAEISAVDPSECGLPTASFASNAIRPNDCVMVNWSTRPIKACRVSPSHPDVIRSVTDSHGMPYDLPIVPSRFVSEDKMREVFESKKMGRTFIQPSAIGGRWLYRAEVCYVCPLEDDWIMRFFSIHGDNPSHKIWPVCVNKPSADYYVEAARNAF